LTQITNTTVKYDGKTGDLISSGVTQESSSEVIGEEKGKQGKNSQRILETKATAKYHGVSETKNAYENAMFLKSVTC